MPEMPNIRTPTLVETLTSVLSKFTLLELLDLLLVEPIEFTDMLRDALFHCLTTFQYTIQSRTAPLIPAFLNRHPTIIDLGLTRREQLKEIDLVNLPNLKNYDGPSSLVRAFGPETRFIDSAVLLCLSSLSSISTMSASTGFQPAAVMESLARHLPNVPTVKFRFSKKDRLFFSLARGKKLRDISCTADSDFVSFVSIGKSLLHYLRGVRCTSLGKSCIDPGSLVTNTHASLETCEDDICASFTTADVLELNMYIDRFFPSFPALYSASFRRWISHPFIFAGDPVIRCDSSSSPLFWDYNKAPWPGLVYSKWVNVGMQNPIGLQPDLGPVG
ncbi:hypothetical protein C8R45DRAFT_1184137 [Mycena sanguinolenta]|nr:hypothetical protein C8R45DRAFT_1184137 [Mycena sanguinolenta]